MTVTTVLLLIILILILLIIWILEFSMINPHKGSKSTQGEQLKHLSTLSKEREENSIIGESKSKPLQVPLPKPTKEVEQEDIDSLFLNNEFEEEYASDSKVEDESEDNQPLADEQKEVIDTQIDDNKELQEWHTEYEQIQKTICIDYNQIHDATKRLLKQEPIDINDAEALSKLEGTSIEEQLERAMPNYIERVRKALAKVDY